VFVNLWATWCPYCREETESIERLYKRQGNKGFAVLTISLGEELETVNRYMAENACDFPVIADRTGKLMETYAPRLPTSYMLDPEGNIIARINGSREWDSDQMLRIFEHLITNRDKRYGHAAN
jgi:thiol-disulfide isomerase/thioredoxin